MNYKDLIKNWHTKAVEEDYFSKFVFEYLAFIAYLKTQKYPGIGNDRRTVQRFKQDSTIKAQYLDLIEVKRSLKKDWECIKNKLDEVRLGNASRDPFTVEEIEWWNCEHDDLNQRTANEISMVKGVIHSLSDWGNMVEFWHSIRNNLFHGAKDPENERDQFAVKYGYRTLKELMEILLNDPN